MPRRCFLSAWRWAAGRRGFWRGCPWYLPRSTSEQARGYCSKRFPRAVSCRGLVRGIRWNVFAAWHTRRNRRAKGAAMATILEYPAKTEARAALLNALTGDVEDYYQVSAFEGCVDRSTWDEKESRVALGTDKILAILESAGVRATFFVLGWVADRNPKLIRAIHAAGHEIASHGYWHRLIYQQTPDEFRADVRRSRN